LREHETALRESSQMFGMGGQYMLQTTSNTDVKPVSNGSTSTLPAPSKCTVVPAKSLQCSTTHRGQVLRGTLVVQPLVYSAVQTILQDEHGDLVKV
jgi:hypothetical protein